MLDFLRFVEKRGRGVTTIQPDYRIDKRNDILTRGSDFYAIWNEKTNLWSKNEVDALLMIDEALDEYAEEYKQKHPDEVVRVLHCCTASTKMVNQFHDYCKNQLRDSSASIVLDQKLIFANQKPKKRDYASRTLPYPLEQGSIEAYDTLMSKLYSPSERAKIEWAIGCIVSGDSVDVQKFLVLYGASGTGKSTVLNIIEALFDGYCATFDAKALGSANDAFALEPFKDNPLVAVQQDGNLSRIEDNSRLNSLVSHDRMSVNTKHKSIYETRFRAFLFMGTNNPVRITDMKSGLTRRLIDVSPTGDKFPLREYNRLNKQISFELGAIAWHCKEVYLADPNKYDNYIPTQMLGASNDLYNYMADNYLIFKKKDCATLSSVWDEFKEYCEEAKVPHIPTRIAVKEDLKNYFHEYEERHKMPDGTRVRNYYSGFNTKKFETDVNEEEPKIETPKNPGWLVFKEQHSLLDDILQDEKAQYANDDGTPSFKWSNVKTTLKDIDTHKLHYTTVPLNHIVIDFDIQDRQGNKSLERNTEEANKWPQTYAELSKSGKGIHLHYIYAGDPMTLSRIYDDQIEVKVFAGKSSLRRQLTKCNDIPIATINSGLPLKGENKVVDQEVLLNDRGLRTFFARALAKEYGSTKSTIQLIYNQLEKQYASGKPYDVSKYEKDVIEFAAGSTHNAPYCLDMVAKMHFCSETESEAVNDIEKQIVIFDIEVFPNKLYVNWKIYGENNPIMRWINPQPEQLEWLFKTYNCIGYNNLRYDNAICFERIQGGTNEDCYNLSKRIISGDRNAIPRESTNLSFSDIYDFASQKQSLKKWEVFLARKWDREHPGDEGKNPYHHSELGLSWDEPVPDEMDDIVSKYCDNDVLMTEALLNYLHDGDWTARLILADVTGMTPNDTTNNLTRRFIFGKKYPDKKKFNYRFLGDTSDVKTKWDDITWFDSQGRPVFNGYSFEGGKSYYLGEEVGEGGWVYSNPGMYGRVITYDIASMHPSSIIAENLFGEYTDRFKDILEARIAIKHKDFDKVKTMMDGAFERHLTSPNSAKALSQALKIAINSVYGLTSAHFDNAFRDERNIDNIVAKRGALFMINLKTEVERRGYTVVHVKTDSIKIANPDDKIQQFVYDYGKMYGYSFEIEHIFQKICLFNKAVYIAKTAADDPEMPSTWTGTGDQVKEETSPYVFKKLFSKQPIEFEDMCEVMTVTTALYLDMNEDLPPGEHNYRFIGKVGQFTPMQKGVGAGVLVRQGKNKDGTIKYDSASGAKGYLWMESEMVRTLKLQDKIDRSYYDKQVDAVVDSMREFGDIEKFISDDDKEPRVGELEMNMILANAMPW